jgi:hypothetical protein
MPIAMWELLVSVAEELGDIKPAGTGAPGTTSVSGGTVLEWNDEGSLRLEFSLNAGAYATVVVRELVEGVP